MIRSGRADTWHPHGIRRGTLGGLPDELALRTTDTIEARESRGCRLGLLKGSHVPPRPIRELREVSRYRDS